MRSSGLVAPRGMFSLRRRAVRPPPCKVDREAPRSWKMGLRRHCSGDSYSYLSLSCWVSLS